jgi:hypothetical protein
MNDLVFFHAYVNNCIEFLWWAWSWGDNVTWTVVNKYHCVTVWNTRFTTTKHQVHLHMHAGNECRLVSCWMFYKSLHANVLDMCPVIIFKSMEFCSDDTVLYIKNSVYLWFYCLVLSDVSSLPPFLLTECVGSNNPGLYSDLTETFMVSSII